MVIWHGAAGMAPWAKEWVAEQVEALGDPKGNPKATVHACIGKQALGDLIGHERVREAQATRKFGEQRATQRSTWVGYAFQMGPNKWAVGLPDPDRVRKQGFAITPVFRAALRNAFWLAEGFRPLEARRLDLGSPPPMDPFGQAVAIDVETAGGHVCRVSLAHEDGGSLYAGSWEWDAVRAALVSRYIEPFSTVVAHNAPFDYALLAKAGLVLDRGSLACSMVAHQLMCPSWRAGLGWCAPLYALLEPFKHLDESDPELYNQMDSVATILMWNAMQRSLP